MSAPTSPRAGRLVPSRALLRQFAVFFVIGLGAVVVHYGLLIAGVEAFGIDPVPAALVGYAGGGFVSYALNRRHTYASERPHAQAVWRFVVVSLVGFGLTFVLMAALTRTLGLPYLPAQLATTGVVMFWSFFANRLWTFGAAAITAPGGR